MATITKTLTKSFGRNYIVAHVEMRENDTRGLSDGFSVTGEIYEPRGSWSGKARYEHNRDCDIAGCVHADIAYHFPQLKPVIDVHLSSLDGTPMHAVANGLYFYFKLADHYNAARSLHVSSNELPTGLTQDEFKAFAESLKPRWAEQARIARELIESL